MKKNIIITLLITFIGITMFNIFRKSEALATQDEIGSHLRGLDYNKENWSSKSETYWKENLSQLQFDVTRKAGTERAFTGKYNTEKREGLYHCSSCGLELFHSDTKFESGTGWPSFFDVIKGGVELHVDTAWGMSRTEVVCSRCKAHLGHVFDDGPKPTGKRYCMNSVSLILSEDLKK